jgi:hypothetical protein
MNALAASVVAQVINFKLDEGNHDNHQTNASNEPG